MLVILTVFHPYTLQSINCSDIQNNIYSSQGQLKKKIKQNSLIVNAQKNQYLPNEREEINGERQVIVKLLKGFCQQWNWQNSIKIYLLCCCLIE